MSAALYAAQAARRIGRPAGIGEGERICNGFATHKSADAAMPKGEKTLAGMGAIAGF